MRPMSIYCEVYISLVDLFKFSLDVFSSEELIIDNS